MAMILNKTGFANLFKKILKFIATLPACTYKPANYMNKN